MYDYLGHLTTYTFVCASDHDPHLNVMLSCANDSHATLFNSWTQDNGFYDHVFYLWEKCSFTEDTPLFAEKIFQNWGDDLGKRKKMSGRRAWCSRHTLVVDWGAKWRCTFGFSPCGQWNKSRRSTEKRRGGHCQAPTDDRAMQSR